MANEIPGDLCQKRKSKAQATNKAVIKIRMGCLSIQLLHSLLNYLAMTNKMITPEAVATNVIPFPK
jgi:hypothetical protein